MSSSSSSFQRPQLVRQGRERQHVTGRMANVEIPCLRMRHPALRFALPTFRVESVDVTFGRKHAEWGRWSARVLECWRLQVCRGQQTHGKPQVLSTPRPLTLSEAYLGPRDNSAPITRDTLSPRPPRPSRDTVVTLAHVRATPSEPTRAQGNAGSWGPMITLSLQSRDSDRWESTRPALVPACLDTYRRGTPLIPVGPGDGLRCPFPVERLQSRLHEDTPECWHG